MKHILFTLLVASISGCAGLSSQPSSVRPPMHPLLGASIWLGGQDGHHPERTPEAHRPTVEDEHHDQIQRNIAGLNPRRFTNNRTTTNLLRAVYANTPVRYRLGRIRSIHEIRALGIIPAGKPRVGDVLFFKPSDSTPHLAVVKAHLKDGRTIAIAPVRGRLREIRVNLKRRTIRRSKGVILNSFIRIRRPGDAPRTGYLAGELVTGLRRLLPVTN